MSKNADHSMRTKYVRLILIAGSIILADQISKMIIVQYMPLYRLSGEIIVVIPKFFNIIHVHNQGGAFGFMADQGPAVRNFLFLVVSTFAIGLVLYFYHTTPPHQSFLVYGLALIFGGAIGNMIDRLRYKYVIDFLDFYIGRYHWPTFNVADSAITIGVMIFILQMLIKPNRI